MPGEQPTLLRLQSEPLRPCAMCQRMLPPASFHRRKSQARTCKTCIKAAAALIGGSCLDAHLDSVRARLRALMHTGDIRVTGCEVCGDANVQAHASSLPGHIVEWLCPLHHAAAHGREDPTRQMALF